MPRGGARVSAGLSRGGCRRLTARVGEAALRKLCNHPKLIYDMLNSKKTEAAADGFQDAGQFFPPGMFGAKLGSGAKLGAGWEMAGGKFALLARMLDALRR